MENEQDFTVQDLIGDLYPEDATETEESPQAAEDAEEVPAGDEPEEPETPEEEETSPEEGDEYDKIEDVVKLRERLRSKDVGYNKMAPFIKTGQMMADALDPDNPKRAEAWAWLKEEYKLDSEPAPASVPTVDAPDFSQFETIDEAGNVVNEAKDHFEAVVRPYTEAVVAKAVEALRRELRSEIDEPLKEYKDSRANAAFEQSVDEQWKVCSKLANLAKMEATRDDLKAAMSEFKPLLDAGTHKPFDLLKLYKGQGKTATVPTKAGLPKTPKDGARTERKAGATDSVNDFIDAIFDARVTA